MAQKILLPTLLVLAGLLLAGCGDYGKVEQGTVVAVGKDKVTLIADSETDPAKPADYTKNVKLVDYVLSSAAPEDRGADPSEGQCVNLDVAKKVITMYNAKEKKFESFNFELVEDINAGIRLDRRQRVLREERPVRPAAEFPVIDEAAKTVQLFYRRLHMNQSRLTTIKLADADFAKFKGKEWAAGDEVRIYYKEPGKALRFMNITKTDITRR